MDELDVTYLLNLCDHPNPAASSANPKGFWRVDKDKDPELRHTVLRLVAFHDLEEKIHKCGGDREKGIEVFFSQNNGEGWMLPETLRLSDYGLGHDERAKEHQPVASRLGPRYYDWQLAQSPEESWRECHLHARNLLGESGYFNLLSEVLRETAEGGWREVLTFACELSTKKNLLRLFEAAFGSLPSESWRRRLDEIKAIMTERGFTLDHDDLIQLIVEALKRIPLGERPDGLKVCQDLLGDYGHRMVVRRLLASELHNPDGPWHLIASKQLDGTNYHALLAEIEAENHGKLAESAAPYDVSKAKMVQLRLFD